MLHSLLKNGVLIIAMAVISTTPISAKGPAGSSPKQEPPSAAAPPVTGGLENIIVETYYISDNNDSTDSDGGHLAPGSVTYRIYVDMAPGYKLMAVFGETSHPLIISTTTGFFNNEAWGASLGTYVNKSGIKYNTVAVDSWITMGGATTGHIGVPKESDTNGSVVGGSHNDGGSAGIEGGLLVNTTGVGIPLTTEDGLLVQTPVPQLSVVNLNLSALESGNTGNSVTTDNGSVFCLNGVQGPTSDNKVLIAQLTTTGTLTFDLNVLLKAPDDSGEYYVSANPEGDQILFPALSRH